MLVEASLDNLCRVNVSKPEYHDEIFDPRYWILLNDWYLLPCQEESDDDDEPAEASVTAEEMEEWKARLIRRWPSFAFSGPRVVDR